MVEVADKEEKYAPITEKRKREKKASTVRAQSPIKAYVIPIPFSQRL